MRGRPPKPTALKLLDGTRPDRLAGQGDAGGLPGTPDRPEHLDPVACEEWARMVEVLDGLKLLSRTDYAALALYCVAYSTWVEAKDRMRTEGMVTVTAAGGLKTSPYVSIAANAWNQLQRMLSEFGLTPSSRARMKLGQGDPPRDELAEFLDEAAP